MIKIIICDDDALYSSKLEELIREAAPGEHLVIEMCKSGDGLVLKDIKTTDLVFLDIQMDGMDGNQAAVWLKKAGFSGLIVQFSGIYNPTPDTIKISPFRYLLKDYDDGKMIEELKEIFTEIKRRKSFKSVEASYNREKVLLDIEDVVYFSRRTNGKCTVHVKKALLDYYQDGDIIIDQSLTELLTVYEEAGFCMPHNSYIINLRHMERFDNKDGTIIVDGEIMNVSRSRKTMFKESLTKYTRRKYQEQDL